MGARADAISALTNLGFTPAVARAAVDAAPEDLPLERLIVEALHCSRPAS